MAARFVWQWWVVAAQFELISRTPKLILAKDVDPVQVAQHTKVG